MTENSLDLEVHNNLINQHSFSMEPPPPPPCPNNHQDDDVFSDAHDDCPFLHSDSHESSPTASTLCDPSPPSLSPKSSIRRRSNRRGFTVTDSTVTGSESSIIDDSSTPTFQSHRHLEILKEFVDFPQKCDSNDENVCSFTSRSVITEEKNEESTLTTAADDDEPGDFADSALELGDSPPNLLEYVAGWVIRAIVFQIKIFFMLMKSPASFVFHAGMFFVDPFGTMRMGKGFLMGILGRVCCCVMAFIGPLLQGIFKEQKSFWNVAFRCGWGFLWSIYVCCILFSLVISSLVFSGFVVKYMVEKPFQMTQALNFDYTKQSPDAYVPIISCAGVGGGKDSKNNLAEANTWVGERVIPPKHKVQATVSLVVPESGYNRNLGIFQIRADFLSSSGEVIGNVRQPCMLKFRSEPIRLLATFVKLIPLVTGFISETQTLNVKMRGFVEGDIPTSCLKVALEQRAEYLPGAGIPQIYDSFIVLESELPLFKRILWHWKISMFIWMAIMAFMMQFLFVLVCCWPVIIPRSRPRSGSARGGTGRENNL